MDKETIFFTLFAIWYFNKYGPPRALLDIIIKLYYFGNNFYNKYNHILAPDYFKYKNTEIEEEKHESIEETKEEPKPEPRYEDKYLNEIRKLEKEFVFDDEEKFEEGQKIIELIQKSSDNRVNEIEKINDKMAEIEIKLTKYEGDEDYCICDDNDEEDSILGDTKEERIKNLVQQQLQLSNEKKKLNDLHSSKEYQEEELKNILNEAKNSIIKKRLEKLKNCYIIEHTPLGNVLMIYDLERESFKFYSDNTIPYRYLEVVGRKYVKQFGCRPIFVDMEEELKLAEERWEKERKEKEEKEQEEKRRKEEGIKNQKPIEEKKNVFAKFKSYNKEAGTGHVNTAAPPKNSIPNKKLTEQQENEKVLLKEKANRYTYEGKFANFSFTKKIDRKVVDKKFGMTFADFKKTQMKKLFD
jgi:hypothetical protein